MSSCSVIILFIIIIIIGYYLYSIICCYLVSLIVILIILLLEKFAADDNQFQQFGELSIVSWLILCVESYIDSFETSCFQINMIFHIIFNSLLYYAT